MGEEFSLFQKIEDTYSIEDILEILGISVEKLLRDYLYDEIIEHKDDFDINGVDDYDEYTEY